MKSNYLLAAAIVGMIGIAQGAPNEESDGPLRIYAKNMARQHLGTNLFVFDTTSQSYNPTEAAAAWLDDDISTGWPPMVGKTYYLLALPEANLLTNFLVSAKASDGTINLYAGDELAEPGAKSWSPIASGVSLASINDRRLTKPFSRFAKYLLIETNLTEAGPWYGLYVYGERPAVSYNLEKRDSAIDLASIFGPYTNDQTAFSFSSLYAGARVTQANAASDDVSWQKAIDDNPQTSLALAPSSADESALVVRFGDAMTIQRVAVLAEGSPHGNLDFYLVENLETTEDIASNSGSNYIRVANSEIGSSETTGTASVAGKTPTATLILDGATARSSIDFPATPSSYILVRWTPSDGHSKLALSELNSFSSASLSTYGLGWTLPVAGELSESSDFSRDGKTVADFKGGKEILPPAVGEFLPVKNPFVPGGLGFPPNISDVAGPQVVETPTSP